MNPINPYESPAAFPVPESPNFGAGGSFARRPSPASDEDSTLIPTIDLVQIWEWVRPRLWIPLLVGAACIGLAIVYAILATPMYRSTAALYVHTGNLIGPDGPERGFSLEVLKSIEQRVLSPGVILRVVDDLELRNDREFFGGKVPTADADLVKDLSARVKAQLRRGSRVVEIIAAHKDPETARDLAAAFAAASEASMIDESVSASSKARVSIDSQIDAQKQEVLTAERDLNQFLIEHTDIPWSEGTNIAQKQLEEMSIRVFDANAKVKLARSQYDQLLAIPDGEPLKILEIGKLANLEPIPKLQVLLAEKRANLASMLRINSPRSPSVQAAQSGVENIEASLVANARTLGQQIRQNYEEAIETEKKLVQEVQDLKVRVANLDHVLAEHRAITMEVDSQRNTLNWLMKERNNLSATAGVYDSPIRLMDTPIVPTKPSSPKKKLAVAFGGVLGGFFGLTALGVCFLFDRSAATEREMGSRVGCEVIASIPKGATETELNTIFRSLQTRVTLSPGPHSGANFVLFGGAESGEGRTFCAVGLANSLIAQRLRVLFIDGDLLNPEATRRLAPEAFHGGVVKTASPYLRLLTGETIFSNGRPPLETLREIMTWARSEFDFVIIDSSPLSKANEALYFARWADAICLVQEAGESEVSATRKAHAQFQQAGAAQIYGVLNGVKPQKLVPQVPVLNFNAVKSLTTGERPNSTATFSA